MTMPASVHNFNAVSRPNTRAPKVSPTMLRKCDHPDGTHRDPRLKPAVAGQITTTYCEAPSASAAVNPGSMTRSDCQP